MKVRLSKCSISETDISAVEKVLRNEYLGMGEDVSVLEHCIQDYLSTDGRVACVNSGTAALHLALAGFGITDGDEVLVPSLTYVATYQAITAVGAIPISCEVDPETCFLDVQDAAKRLTSRTRAILPVHYASACRGMSHVYGFAEKNGLIVIEDAAQSFGSNLTESLNYKGRQALCFSFDGIKNITAGEGGAVFSHDKMLIERIKDMRLLGVEKDSDARIAGVRSWDFDVNLQGYRYHMSNINAGLAISQLARIDQFKTHRQSLVFSYLDMLKDVPEVSPLNFQYDEIMPHIFVIRAKDRDLLREYLKEKGVETGIHYKPNHLLTRFFSEQSLPVTEELYSLLLTLPCHLGVDNDAAKYVVDMIKEFYVGSRA